MYRRLLDWLLKKYVDDKLYSVVRKVEEVERNNVDYISAIERRLELRLSEFETLHNEIQTACDISLGSRHSKSWAITVVKLKDGRAAIKFYDLEGLPPNEIDMRLKDLHLRPVYDAPSNLIKFFTR